MSFYFLNAVLNFFPQFCPWVVQVPLPHSQMISISFPFPLPNDNQLPTSTSANMALHRNLGKPLLKPFNSFHNPHFRELLNLPQEIIAIQNPIHHARPPLPPEVQLAPHALPCAIMRVKHHAASVGHGVNPIIHDGASVHPILADFRRAWDPLQAARANTSTQLADRALRSRTDINLAIDDADSGEHMGDAHEGSERQ